MERNYTAPQLGVQDTRQVRGSQLAGSAQQAAPMLVGDSGWRDGFLTKVLGDAGRTFQQLGELEMQNAYLEGQASVGVVESEAELEGNIITRNWKIAGFRDTTGKLNLANADAQFQIDLKRLREAPPEEMEQYLTQRRSQLLADMSGMSREARATQASQLLLSDKAAISKYTAERAKFIIEQKSQAVATQWQVVNSGLQQAQVQVATGAMTQQAYTDQVRNAAGTLVTSIALDNGLPDDVKRELITGNLQNSLASDSVELYEYLQANQVPDGQGGSMNLISVLDNKQQLTLANAYRESMQRTSDIRNIARSEQLAQVTAQIDAGTYGGSFNDLTALLRPMVVNRTLGGTAYQGILNNYLDKQAKGEQASAAAGMVMRGDIVGLYNAGYTREQGIKAVQGVLAKQQATPEQYLSTWLNVGMNGEEKGFEQAGEMLGITMRQIAQSKDGTILPQHREMFRTVNAAIARAEQQGLSNTRSRLLGGMPEDDRMFAEQVLRRIDGQGLDGAVESAKALQAQDSKLAPAARAALAQATNADIVKRVNQIDSVGLVGSVWQGFKGMFSAEASADSVLRPTSTMSSRDGWFTDSPAVRMYTERVRQEVLQEASDAAVLRPSASADEVISNAKANVAARTIETRHGPVVMPRGTDLQTVFGVAPGNQAGIGKAIDGMLVNTVADSRWFVSFQQGRMFAQEYDKNGTAVGQGQFFDPKAVSARIADDTTKELKQAGRVFGEGRKVKAGSLSVQYNGENTAGAPYSWMYGFRDNLVAHEGIRDEPYDDLSGKAVDGKRVKTVGVGVSSHNSFYPKVGPDGKVSTEDIQSSFLSASNEAAQAGYRLAKQAGLNNEAAFQLFAELAYQSGPAFATQGNKTGDRYRELVEAMQAGDVEKAKAAFKGTAAWYYSGGDGAKRNRSYLNLVETAMRK